MVTVSTLKNRIFGLTLGSTQPCVQWDTFLRTWG